ncbi:MAG: methyltransferase, partial [Thermoleophilaceae bacterium]
MSRQGLDDWRLLAGTQLFPRLVDEGKLVRTEEVEGAEAPPGLRAEQYGAVLRHELIPFVSYPYEWTPGMLRDAALLTLDLMLASLDEDLVLKDATPYNVQFRGSRPVFVDVGSWEKLNPGEPWAGYRQFCMQFLYPLMLQAYKGVTFQPWLRGALDGITPAQARALMSFRDRFRKGTTTHVFIHARLDRSYSQRGRTGGDVKKELKSAGFGKELIRANVRKVRKAVEAADWSPPKSVWTAYRGENTYDDADNAAKAAFIRDVAGRREWKLAWDLGANDGYYSRLIAEQARTVLALDLDPSTVELLYRDLKAEGNEQILPL